MIGGNANSRRADDFDALLSGRTPQGAALEEYADLLDLVGALRAVPAPVARPAFVADLRERLVAEATANPVVVADETSLRLTPKQRRGARERRLAALVGGFAVVAATGSMAVASESSLPGDVLYPVKRAIENAHANMQSSPDAKASVLLHNANTRLSEVEQLSQRHDSGDANEISSTLQAFKDQTAQASALALDDYSREGNDTGLTAVRDFASSSMQRLTALDEAVPAPSRPALIAAAQTVKSIDSAAFTACPTCSGPEVTQLPDFAMKQLSSLLKSPLVQDLVKPPAIASQKPTGTASATPNKATATSSPSVGSSTSAGTGNTGTTGKSGTTSSSGGGTDKKQGLVSGTLNELTKDLLGTGTTSGQKSDPSSTQSQAPSVLGSVLGLLGVK